MIKYIIIIGLFVVFFHSFSIKSNRENKNYDDNGLYEDLKAESDSLMKIDKKYEAEIQALKANK